MNITRLIKRQSFLTVEMKAKFSNKVEAFFFFPNTNLDNIFLLQHNTHLQCIDGTQSGRINYEFMLKKVVKQNINLKETNELYENPDPGVYGFPKHPLS